MDVEGIKTFCMVARYKSFRKAAEVLQLTQPSVSRRLQNLEQQLGVALFERSPQFVALTKHGKEFLPYAERVLSVLSEGMARLAEGLQNEILRIAATPTVSFHWLPRVIQTFKAAYPQVYLHVFTANSAQVFEKVLDQTVDVGLVTVAYNNPLVERERVDSEEIVCVAQHDWVQSVWQATDHRPHSIPVIGNDLTDPPWDAIHDYLANHPEYYVSVRAEYIQVVEQLVRHGLGLAFLPASAAAPGMQTGDLVRVHPPGLSLPERPVYLISLWRAEERAWVAEWKRYVRMYVAELKGEAGVPS
ncbi:MAG: LysR family transcriptional regulator [Alicyclobacillus sp.]|nr:LysR family transcriptional regulator [Alicyclobacillus sp.]